MKSVIHRLMATSINRKAFFSNIVQWPIFRSSSLINAEPPGSSAFSGG